MQAQTDGVKTDVAKGFGSVRAEMAKEFGSLRAEMKASTESLKTAIEKAKPWMLAPWVTAVMLMLFSIVGHALKII